MLASATDRGLLRLHYHTGSLMGELPNEGSAEQTMAAVACIAFSRGSKMLAAGCSDAQQHVWDLKLQVSCAPLLRCQAGWHTIQVPCFQADGWRGSRSLPLAQAKNLQGGAEQRC